ncbi:ABC transporter substrate-binding protein [Aureimonas fodinaquatilis]|uniref:ABC transporter substrate-binding protein n=1 Tax=Aureimonas fodinaquatilis TaxID=2565783 RepID=A0A5B0E0V7_9HYPH|nr:ABC transporter substrate-binding protein [Aureimonas fodinaquatilis]KAA0971755.1 ABC transporter substrate-binding protein [Aureimonas fodinaquatilis]
MPIKKTVFLAMAFAALAPLISGGVANAQDKVIKIGQLGVMSGPAASWGLVNRYAAEAHAAMINAGGGWDVDGEKYRIEIVSIDDRNDPRTAIAGAERLIYQEGVKYIIGTNVDDTTQAILPTLATGGAFAVSYGHTRSLFETPNDNTGLGNIAGYQMSPIIYKFLVEDRGIKSVSFIARNDLNGLGNRDAGVEAAKALNLEIMSSNATYEAGTTDFFPVLSPLVRANPDMIVLSGVAPSDAGLLIRAARELGYGGIISTETAHDAAVLSEIAGEAANGFISQGGASTPEIRTPYVEEFMENYTKVAGEWNDEAGTKIYALEMILQTISAAGAEALTDVEAFKAAIPEVDLENPFVIGGEPRLRWVGADWFGHPRQVSVPVVVNAFQDGAFETLVVTSVE